MVPEREAPGANPNALVRVPQHTLQPFSEFGLCPASLLSYPLSDYDQQQLAAQADVLQAIIEGRFQKVVEDAGDPVPKDWKEFVKDPEPYRPGRVPQPDANPKWFKQGPGQGTRAGHGGRNFSPPLPVVLLPEKPANDDSTKGGPNMASVEEVKAIVSAAGVHCAEVSGALFALESQAGEALQLLNFVRETSVDPMGAPEVAQAIEKIGEANALLRRAVEIGNTYKGTL